MKLDDMNDNDIAVIVKFTNDNFFEKTIMLKDNRYYFIKANENVELKPNDLKYWKDAEVRLIGNLKQNIIKKFITKDGTQLFYQNDKLHRDNDKPAIIFKDGTKCWYQNDKLHRETGPAIENSDGSKCWYQNDKLHRETGPAIENSDGSKLYYLLGEGMDKADFDKTILEQKKGLNQN